MSDSHPSLTTGSIDPKWRIAIIRSVWHNECTSALTADAVNQLISRGIKQDTILTINAPGSYEIPLLTKTIIEAGKADVVIAFGVIVQGETHHAEIIAKESARAIMDIQLLTGVPIIYEILFVNTIEDARNRSIGPGAKGALAADTALAALANLIKLR